MRFGKLGTGFGGLGSQGGPVNSIIPGLITAGTGNYVWSGDTMVPLVDYIIAAGAGSYAFSGSAASFLRSRLVAASGGSYTYTGQAATLTVASASTTTWNSADKHADITLSGGDLIATKTGTTAFRGFRGVANHSTGKYYWEYVVGSEVTANNTYMGFSNSSQALTTFMGSSNNSVAWATGATQLIKNSGGFSSGTGVSYAAGDVVSWALDLDNSRVWVRKNGGNWMNDGAKDPATNTGGIDISGVAAGPYYPSGSLLTATDYVTANFGGSAYTYTPPSGFGNW